jgi:hypothetical protein
MKPLFMDPVVLASGGVLLFAIILWFWALSGLRRAKAPAPSPDLDLPFPTQARSPLHDIPTDFPMARTPTPAPSMPASGQVVVPEINRQVAEKVDLIALRLVDMQMLLNKQLSAPAGGATMPPEMVDKLMGIMNTVVAQVDVLQKTMAQAKGEGVVKTPDA